MPSIPGGGENFREGTEAWLSNQYDPLLSAKRKIVIVQCNAARSSVTSNSLGFPRRYQLSSCCAARVLFPPPPGGGGGLLDVTFGSAGCKVHNHPTITTSEQLADLSEEMTITHTLITADESLPRRL